MAREKSANQIMRFDGRNVFFEVMNSAFPIGKVQINFIEYDDKTNKQTKKIDIYMDLGKALVLCQDILSGRLGSIVAHAKKTGTFEGKPVNDYTAYFLDMGGRSEEKANREDGKALSRQFKIQAGMKMPWILRAEQGPGETNATGLIVPKGRAEEYINIPLTDENMKEFALMLQMHLQAYFNHVYTNYSKDLFPTEKINVYRPKK